MANDNDSDNKLPVEATFTTERLRNLVIDHVIDNASLFLPQGPGAAEHLLKLLDSLEKMGQKIATEAITNRQNLSPLPTFDSIIHPNPEQNVSDSTRYEMRFRLVEQIGNEAPFKDEVMSRSEVEKEHGVEFFNAYWGEMGEKCPNNVTTGDRTLWFTAVRYPVLDQSATQSANASDTPRYRSPSNR
ncbi:hypothetical protein ACEN2T_17220 [Pseudomonas sp. W22_MBD1_FP4]|uniref:hypothetical protein n=1 Tax=Pseudomonas sp. W22_MBD1_FP4 TaxID=3240272 RepID=UPI003F97FED4